MRVDEIIARGSEPSFSFEFFPPKTEEGERTLQGALVDLRLMQPSFVSVTWGAGGSTRDRTIGIVKGIKQDHGLEAMAHFTCVDATVEDLHAALREMRDAGIDNVLTLRGDPPAGQERFERIEGGLGHANELAELVARHYDFCIVGACYPDVHPEAPDEDADLRNLKLKVEAGVRVLITNLFFDNGAYFRFVARAREAGIDVPIVPGIMPIISASGIRRMSKLSGAYIPPALEEAIVAREDDPDALMQLGVSYATLQCAELLAHGAPGIHFYTLNRSPATRAILTALRLHRPWEQRPGGEPASALAFV